MKKLFCCLLFSLFLFSCSKEGPGGNTTIQGVVRHHDVPIPGAVAYIKYDVKEFPGTNIADYDASVNADENAYYKFIDLKKGNYFLFAVGFDTSKVYNSQNLLVKGGIPIKIKKKTETVETDIPVKE